MTITRYSPDMDGSMEPDENGEWVRYELHARCEAVSIQTQQDLYAERERHGATAQKLKLAESQLAPLRSNNLDCKSVQKRLAVQMKQDAWANMSPAGALPTQVSSDVSEVELEDLRNRLWSKNKRTFSISDLREILSLWHSASAMGRKPPRRATPVQQGVGEADTGPQVLREVFALCEATEDAELTGGSRDSQAAQDFLRGRKFEAKGIRKAIGIWFQDEFCGRTHMGEPIITPPAAPAVPALAPMTDDQVWHNDAIMSANGIIGFKMGAVMQIVRGVEAHHAKRAVPAVWAEPYAKLLLEMKDELAERGRRPSDPKKADLWDRSVRVYEAMVAWANTQEPTK